MYHPYFRGKQFELLTIRETAKLMAASDFTPIIEPVKEGLKGLDRALKAITKAARDAGASDVVLGVELMTEAEQERRLTTPQIPELCGLSEVGDILGVTRQRAGQLASDNDDFPPAVARLKAGPVYVKWQVEAFKSRWARRAGRPAKVA